MAPSSPSSVGRRRVLSVSACSLLSGLAGCQTIGDVLSGQPRPSIRWKETFSREVTGLVVGPGSVYVATSRRSSLEPNDLIARLDRTDGTSKWTLYGTSPERVPVDVALAPGRLFFHGELPDHEGTLHAIDLETGQPRWHVAETVSFPPADLTDETVYVSTPDRHSEMRGEDVREPGLQARDLRSGAVRWSFDSIGRERPVAARDGTLYLTTMGGGYRGFYDRPPGAYALDAADGSVRWRYAPETQPGPAALEGETLFVGTDSADGVPPRVSALDTADGTVRWRYEAPIDGNEGGFAWPRSFIDDRAMVSARDRTIAVDVETGGAIWSVRGRCIGSRTARDDAVYVRRDGTAIAVNADDGAERWRFTAPASEPSEPAHYRLHGGMVIGISERTVSAVDADTGEERWRFIADADISSEPWRTEIEGGDAYLSAGKTVYALDLS